MKRYTTYHPLVRCGTALGTSLFLGLIAISTARAQAQATFDISATSNGGDLHEGSYGEIYSTIGEPVASDSTSLASNETTWTGFWQVLPVLPIGGVEEEHTGGFSTETMIATVAPDPFTTELGVELALAHRGDVRLLLFDMAGRPVGSLLDGVREAGTIRLRWRPEGLATGNYILQLLVDGQREGTRLVHYYR